MPAERSRSVCRAGIGGSLSKRSRSPRRAWKPVQRPALDEFDLLVRSRSNRVRRASCFT